jgi:uncharacterized protein
MDSVDYVRALSSLEDIDPQAWDDLLALQPEPTPFMRHAYLFAMTQSGSACAATGWQGQVLCLRDAAGQLLAACPVYLKAHSYGEYVFDWSWANAYAEHGLAYYPKALVAVPFTPVPGTRLLARTDAWRLCLVQALVAWCEAQQLSSLHLLFGAESDIQACEQAGLMLRHTVQFHWQNTDPGFRDFEEFLSTLTQEKRKKIRQERRKVRDAGVQFRWSRGADISSQDWAFFYRCYERTYREHGNPPYLTRDFFERMAATMPQNWLLFVGERAGQAIACSLIALSDEGTPTAYGRYWGAEERVDCLHFEACYYQPLQWCVENGIHSFEGGAQGEHKMARALLPIRTSSAHWLAHPAFAQAVERFLDREGQGVDHYLLDLAAHSPLRRAH